MAAPAGITVNTGALVLIDKNEARTKLTLQNNTGVAVFIGENSTVTAANGYKLADGEELVFTRTKENSEWFYYGDYWAIIASGSQTMIVWEQEIIR